MTANRRGTLACICSLLVAATLCAAFAHAAPSEPAAAAQDSEFVFSPEREITVVGTVEKLDTEHAPGVPAGLHLFLSSSGKKVDAHLGPYLSQETTDALKAAPMVQVVGVTENIRGKEILLVRELVFSGRHVTIRNEHGFLVRERRPRRNSGQSKSAANGDAQ